MLIVNQKSQIMQDEQLSYRESKAEKLIKRYTDGLDYEIINGSQFGIINEFTWIAFKESLIDDKGRIELNVWRKIKVGDTDKVVFAKFAAKGNSIITVSTKDRFNAVFVKFFKSGRVEKFKISPETSARYEL